MARSPVEYRYLLGSDPLNSMLCVNLYYRIGVGGACQYIAGHMWPFSYLPFILDLLLRVDSSIRFNFRSP
jgi:hypothetical protein